MSSASQLAQKSKRRNATLSCAECRRLKLRCSRVFPCASCVKKGCAAICPDGSLTTGKGNRFVLANTEVLHDKITILAGRVRALEDALQEAHSAISSEPHPLLTEELRALKRPLERESPEEQAQDQDQESVESINVGSLSITESGHTKFYGGMANAWYLLQNEAGSDTEDDSPQIQLPADIPWLSHKFPFYTALDENAGGIRDAVLAALPDHAKARRLASIYFKHAAWMYTPVPEAEFEETVFSRVYDQRMETDPAPMDAHRLAVLCLVLGLGALLDLEKPSLSTEAMRYYQLGRAALSIDSILESQSIPAIQALILMCHYMFLSFVDGPRWALMGLAVKLAQSLGLHRDSGRWNLDEKETFRRRSLFYELYTYDSWQSLTYGRPPSFAPAFIDCKMPEEPRKNEQGDVEMSFPAWKHRFSFKCLAVVHERAFGATVPRYSVISELDKKVRDFYIPPSLRVPGFGGAPLEGPHVQPPIELTMQRYTAFAIKEMTLFYLHRGFFAHALEESPGDPLGSKYAPSVLAAYTCACSFVGLVRSLYSQHPGLTERMWFLFTHVFSCSIVLGSIATKCPTMALAPSALSNLDSALNLFNDVSNSGNVRAAKVLPVLRKLKARAQAAKQAASTSSQHANVAQSPTESLFIKEEDEELAALGGKTRLVSRKSPSATSNPSSPRESSQQSVSPVEQSGGYMQPDTPSPAPPQISPQASISSSTIVSPGPESPGSVHGVMDDGVRWNGGGYLPGPSTAVAAVSAPVAAADVYDYGYTDMAQWQQAAHHTPHGHMPMQGVAMDVHAAPVQYDGYEQVGYAHPYPHQHPASSMAAHPQHYVQPQSPVHGHHGHVSAADPHASWNYLFAQFNQV
ncbi:fungal-specific transcription factor domain-containing protein [Trametes punicea]|nr:fungal-specific transcription factor domain-containing protein [Trametes punicea]